MKKQFKKIYIEILNYCNLNCSFCPRTTREKHTMSVGDFKNIIMQSKNFTDIFCLHLMGEPTLHPNFKDILKICDEQKIKVELTTNGTNLLQEILSCNSITKISLSLNAYESFSSDEVERIMLFAKLASDANKIVELKFFDSSELYEKFPKNLPHNVFYRFINKFKWPVQSLNGNKKTCLGGKTHIGILCDGTVVPCCLDNNGGIPLGNVLITSLKNILSGERFLSFGESFRKGKPNEELCKTCEFKK